VKVYKKNEVYVKFVKNLQLKILAIDNFIIAKHPFFLSTICLSNDMENSILKNVLNWWFINGF